MYRYLFLVVGLLSFQLEAQEWQNYPVNNSIMVDFPSEPILGNQGKLLTYLVQYQENVVVTTIDSTLPISNIPTNEVSSFFNGVTDGFINSSNGKLVNKKEFTLNTISGREMHLIINVGPVNNVDTYVRHFIVDSSLYSVTVMYTSKNEEKDLHQRIFNSIKLKNN